METRVSLRDWLDNGWLKRHVTSSKEIENLLDIVERDLEDARSDISTDWKFGIAYNAALKLCTIALYAEGYRAEKNLQHYRTIQALPIILGNDLQSDADYLETCRKKRNIVEYDYVGGVTGSEAAEFIAFVEELWEKVITYLKSNHPNLLAPDGS